MKNRKGFISFDAVILGAIVLILLAGFMPRIRLAIGQYGTRTGNQILMYETGTGSHLAANPGGTTGVNPGDFVVDDELMVDKVIVTRKLYFADPYPQVNTDEMITLTVIAEPDDISYQGIAWNILSGGSHAYIIKSRDSKSVEITGVTPGRIVLQASAKDASGKVAYAYVDVIRQPQSIYLDLLIQQIIMLYGLMKILLVLNVHHLQLMDITLLLLPRSQKVSHVIM